jgi:hypothetical protein
MNNFQKIILESTLNFSKVDIFLQTNVRMDQKHRIVFQKIFLRKFIHF